MNYTFCLLSLFLSKNIFFEKYEKLCYFCKPLPYIKVIFKSWKFTKRNFRIGTPRREISFSCNDFFTHETFRSGSHNLPEKSEDQLPILHLVFVDLTLKIYHGKEAILCKIYSTESCLPVGFNNPFWNIFSKICLFDKICSKLSDEVFNSGANELSHWFLVVTLGIVVWI